jgi:hypothetical protein
MDTPTINVEIGTNRNVVMSKPVACLAAAGCVGIGVAGTLGFQYYGAVVVHTAKQAMFTMKQKFAAVLSNFRKPSMTVQPEVQIQRSEEVIKREAGKIASAAEELAEKNQELRGQIQQVHEDSVIPSKTNETPHAPLGKELRVPMNRPNRQEQPPVEATAGA